MSERLGCLLQSCSAWSESSEEAVNGGVVDIEINVNSVGRETSTELEALIKERVGLACVGYLVFADFVVTN